ncbi:hypothetical protein BDP27DRAFT_1420249 [Rhodocollybia butyracea]|uniref:Fungal-type protein kinase domain-containing protein n=1 Tax=Rhodocollybia butyracea TaxID=206335 RepID=A0A9P5PW38_9AGAR|nr:hypothetical protein BDP27DRAFT_1420249 [Rhodocollybia butyracea]
MSFKSKNKAPTATTAATASFWLSESHPREQDKPTKHEPSVTVLVEATPSKPVRTVSMLQVHIADSTTILVEATPVKSPAWKRWRRRKDLESSSPDILMLTPGKGARANEPFIDDDAEWTVSTPTKIPSFQSVIELEKFYHTESQRQRGGRIYKPPCNSSDTSKDNKSDCVVDAATPNCSNRLPLSSLPYTPATATTSVAFPANYSFSYTAGGIYQALGSGKGRTFSFIKNSPPIDPPNVGSDGSRLYIIYWGLNDLDMVTREWEGSEGSIGAKEATAGLSDAVYKRFNGVERGEAAYEECRMTGVLAALKNKMDNERFIVIKGERPEAEGMPAVKYDALVNIAQMKAEMQQYAPFITAMKDYLSPEWVLINTSNHCDASSFSAKYFSLSAIKPDIGLYEASKYNPDSTTNSASVELFGEFKVKKHDNPFPPAKTLPESAKDTRDQITLYLNDIQAAQQRTRVFLFFTLGDQCRLFCHLHAGTQYTDPFNHTTMPYLHEFLWRLTHSSPADRGHDVTMEPVLPCDPIYKEVSQVLMAGLRGNPNLKALHKHFYGEVGQGTRCFVAFDHENRRLMLLKDFWRNWKYDSEYETYKALECKGVSHVPHALAGEDIAGRFQQTKVLGIKLVHFRLVLDIVGEPLTKCISTHQFAQIISDALQGTVNHPLS